MECSVKRKAWQKQGKEKVLKGWVLKKKKGWCNYDTLFWIFFFLTVPLSMWGLSCLTRDQTLALCSGSMES